MSHPTFVLVLASALLGVVAGWDIAKRRIPNWANAALGVTGLGAQMLFHGGYALLGAVGAATITLILLWLPWSRGRLGGGDVKATLCATTWLGLGLLGQYYLYTALAAGGVALLCFLVSSRGARREIRENMFLVALKQGLPEAPFRSGAGRVSVPFGSAAAAAALFLLWTR
jgi:Flp pilus assembly protein protease CpaA